MASENVKYNNLPIRVTTALIGAFFIIFHGRWDDFFTAFSDAGFYIAFAVSFAVALLLIYMIHRSTKWLDQYYRWRDSPLERAVLQISVGLVLPVVADLVLISVHLALRGENIFNSGFLEFDFPIIFIFLVVVNLYYVVHYFFATERTVQEAHSLMIEHNGTFVRLDVCKEIIYFYKDGNLVKAVCSAGEEYTLVDSLKKIQERYEDFDFCRINKSVIVNVAMLRGYQNILNKRAVLVIFKPQVMQVIENRESLQFLVTTNNISGLQTTLKRITGKQFA